LSQRGVPTLWKCRKPCSSSSNIEKLWC